MKKIMIMFAAVGMTVIANAANVNWSVLNVYTPSTSLLSPNNKNGGVKMTMAEAANLVISVYWLNGDTWEAITPGDSATTLTAAGTKASGTLWSQAEAVANRDDAGNAYFKVVLEYTTSDYIYTVEKESGSKSLANITSAATTIAFNMNGETWTATAVPEPTSGLLMLVGLAGLALRRKRS